ncbi:hypothetical protein AMTRI_Chr07g75450 [Amborella trichopoda]
MGDIAQFSTFKYELQDDYENYNYWKSCMHSYLKAHSLLDVISDSYESEETNDENEKREWSAKDGKVLYILKTSINPKLFLHISTAKTAKEAWYILTSLKKTRFRNQIPRSHACDINEMQKRKMYKASINEECETLHNFYQEITNNQNASDTSIGCTILHLVTQCCHVKVLNKLLEMATEDALSCVDEQGNTILHVAAMVGSIEKAQAVLRKKPESVTVRNHSGETPIFVAAKYGHKAVFAYLTMVGRVEGCVRSNSGATILHAAIIEEFYDLALEIAERYPTLAHARDERGMTPMHILGSSPKAFKSGTMYYSTNIAVSSWVVLETIGKLIYSCIPVYDKYKGRPISAREDIETPACTTIDHRWRDDGNSSLTEWTNSLALGCPLFGRIYQTKQKHKWVRNLVEVLLKFESNYSYENDGQFPYELRTSINAGPESLSKRNGMVSPLVLAARKDIVELVREILGVFPSAIEFLDEDGKNIMHLAVEHRGEKVFWLLRSMGTLVCSMAMGIDRHGRSILHLAAKLGESPPYHTLASPQYMQRELLWFKRVNHVCPPHIVAHIDSHGHTAQESFAATHSGLVKDGEVWLKQSAQTCVITSTLIITILFAATFTVPGGNHETTGIPIFLHDKKFKMFMDYLNWTLFFSSQALAFFTSVLTTRYDAEDFYIMLPMKYFAANTFLFLSAWGTIITFSVAYTIVADSIFGSSHLVGMTLAAISTLTWILTYMDGMTSTVSSTCLIFYEELKWKVGVEGPLKSKLL